MIQLKQLSLRRGVKELFRDVTLTIHPGWRVGVVGGNGAGKSSLFALLRDELSTDSGDLFIPPGWVTAHVAQETPALACSALDYTLDGDRELRQLEADLATAEAAHDGEAIGHLHAELARIDAYSAPARAARRKAGVSAQSAVFGVPAARPRGRLSFVNPIGLENASDGLRQMRLPLSVAYVA